MDHEYFLRRVIFFSYNMIIGDSIIFQITRVPNVFNQSSVAGHLAHFQFFIFQITLGLAPWVVTYDFFSVFEHLLCSSPTMGAVFPPSVRAPSDHSVRNLRVLPGSTLHLSHLQSPRKSTWWMPNMS